MGKARRIVTVMLGCVMLLGGTLTANAATPRNNWCHPGAADTEVSGTHDHGDGYGVHDWTGLRCAACGKIKITKCWY